LADESELIQKIRDGDEEAFGSLVRQHQASLTRVAMAYVKNPTAAAEVVQETWIAVIEGLERFEQRSSLRTWIYRILANQANTRRRKDRRSVPLSAIENEDQLPREPGAFDARGHWMAEPPAWQEMSAEQLILQKQVRQAMEQAIEDLPANQRVVVTLRDLEGWEAAEVCNALDITNTNQRVLLHRARARLREAIAEALEAQKSE
jgi:RNA polymerase sigma-70 factor (ECF subfamily)